MPSHQRDSRPRVLACRPSHQNSQWCEALSNVGFEPINIPLLAINPLSEPKAKRRVQNIILNIDQYNPVIFVSQNAVTHFFDNVDQFWPELPQHWILIGVGQATKLALECACDKFGGVYLPKILGGKQAMNSQSLLEMSILNDVKHKKILICRGQGGRPELGDRLSARGADVSYCELYKREMPKEAKQKIANISFNPLTDCLPFFSGESFQNFMTLKAELTLGSGMDENITDTRVVVPGERVYNLVKQAGFKNAFIAQNATTATMLKTIQSAYA